MKFLDINKLYEHPNNPRQNVGDVTELADSIKANGIYQNLTVIEGGPGVPTGETGYTVIIGHRRLAAAKAAGLTEVPCSIAVMSEREQISTMLLENMQRSDLTTYEQAQGFQMMLDLGETQQSISELTGFSEATVCRRLKLLALDKKKFAAAEERGGTLEEYIKVSEIKNDKDRQKVLDAIGTNNFEWKLRDALAEQKRKENLPKVKKELRAIAKEDKTIRSWDSKYEVVASRSIANYEEGYFKQFVKPDKEYFWNISSGDWVYLFVKKPKVKKETPKKSKKEIAADETRKQLHAISKQAYEMRRDFIDNFFAAKKYANVLNEWLWEIQKNIATGYGPTKDREYMCGKIGQYEKYAYYLDEEKLSKFFEKNPGNAPAVFIYYCSGDNANLSYITDNYCENMPEKKEEKRLDVIYKYLCKLGYQMSDVELQLQDGTHELFRGKK